METPREIAKYLRPGARIVSIGLGADDAAATIGVAPDASYGTASEFAASPEDAVDLLVVARSVLAAGLLADAAGRRGEAGVVTVPCEVDLSRRLLDSPGVPEIVTALSEAGYSISSPARWLDRADRSPLLIVARADGRTIRPWAPGDEREILDLFEACFHSRRSVEWWRWEYAENPHGPLAASLAFDGDGLAAQYAGYPVPLWSANPELHGLTAHQIGDTMTATRVRSVGRGPTSVLVRTAKHFFASRCAGKVAFNYGFNTANIRTISTSYNESVQVEPVPFRRAETTQLRFPGLLTRKAAEFLRGYSLSGAESLGAEWDAFLEHAAPSYGFLVRRDARYLRWRYLEHPALKYEIFALRCGGELAGWSVFLRRDDTLVWGDALFAPRHAQAAGLLLHHALAAPVGAGARAVECWFPSRPVFFSAVVDRLGLVIGREPHDLALMCTPFVAEDAAERLARDFYYAACDSDLY